VCVGLADAVFFGARSTRRADCTSRKPATTMTSETEWTEGQFRSVAFSVLDVLYQRTNNECRVRRRNSFAIPNGRIKSNQDPPLIYTERSVTVPVGKYTVPRDRQEDGGSLMADSDANRSHVVVSFGRPVTDSDLQTLKATEDVLSIFRVPDEVDVHINIDGDGPGFHWPPPHGDPAY
jgi:hypothetical protein